MSASTAAAPAGTAPRLGGTLAVARAERRKLVAQLAPRVLALICAFGPFAFAAVLSLQSGVPGDTVLGIWVNSSGYTFAFVLLGFCGYLGFPVLAGVLAGDVFSSEDRYETWKSTLTRSCSRGEVFAGKCLAVLVIAAQLLALTAVSSLLAGIALDGSHAVVGLDGSTVAAGEALWVLAVSWLVSLPPFIALASLAVLLSVASRSGIVGVLGPVLVSLLMELLALVGNGSWMHALLITTSFAGWHGLLAEHRFYAPLLIGTAVSLLWSGACLAGAWAILRGRDFAGPAVSRSRGWAGPARAVGAAFAVILALGVAGGLGPAAVTSARLEGSLAAVFQRLTILQQRELGHTVPAGTRLDLLTHCYRHNGKSVGSGDDWSCTLTLLHPAAGVEAFQTTAVTYDVSVKSEGCYRAQAPPSFVGSQTMTDATGHHVVNPLFSIYGCFDPTAAAPRTRSGRRTGHDIPPTPSQRKAELHALHQAEHQAGATVIREIEQAQREEKRNAEGPAERAAQPRAK